VTTRKRRREGFELGRARQATSEKPVPGRSQLDEVKIRRCRGERVRHLDDPAASDREVLDSCDLDPGPAHLVRVPGDEVKWLGRPDLNAAELQRRHTADQRIGRKDCECGGQPDRIGDREVGRDIDTAEESSD
jgi:hypothetical protein